MEKRFNYNTIEGYYTDEGKGDVIVFIHGFCADGSIWGDFVQPFKGEYRVLITDLPGYRYTGLPDVEPTIEVMADFVYCMLQDAGVNKATIVGHSMGGYIALVLARLYPDVISKLVLFSSHPFIDADDTKKSREKTMTFVEKHGAGLLTKELYASMVGEKYKKEQPDAFSRIVEQFSHYPTDTVIFSSKAMLSRRDETAALQVANFPVMYIVGREDNLIAFEKWLQQMAYPSVSSVHIIDEVGHCGMFEAKNKIVQLMLEFCNLSF